MRFNTTITAAALALALLAQPAAALAAGTGDDPTPTHDVQTAQNVRVERDFQAWLRAQRLTTKGTLAAHPTIIDAPHISFYTPTHYQEKSYYCGVATVQMIDDYWGACASQSAIAKYLGADSDGVEFSRVDNAINYFAGENYVYYGPCSSTSDFYYRVAYGLETRRHPMAIDMKIDADAMNYYIYDHDGHITVLEAFDWRYGTVRLNDPYDEQDWRPGGGATGGHRTYPASQIASAVMHHFRKAVVY